MITVLEFNNLLPEPLHSTGTPTKKSSRLLHNWNWYNHYHMLDSYFLVCKCDSFQSKQATVSSTVQESLPSTLVKQELVTNSCYPSECNIAIEMRGVGGRAAFKLHVAMEDVIVSLSATGTRSYNHESQTSIKHSRLFFLLLLFFVVCGFFVCLFFLNF